MPEEGFSETMLAETPHDKEDCGVKGNTDSVNDSVNDSANDSANGLNSTERKVYAAIKRNREITYSALMNMYNLSQASIARACRELKKKGYIVREGSDKTGKWAILK